MAELRLGQRCQQTQPLAVIWIELDGIKRIEESFGQAKGDRLLHAVVERLSRFLGPTDILAQIGRSEFLIVHSLDPTDPTGIQLAGEILAGLGDPMGPAEELDLALSAWAGVSCFPQDSTEPETLVLFASTALGQARRRGTQAILRYSPEMTIRSRHRLAIEAHLQRAVEADQLELLYQPQVNGQGDLLGAEALLRWHSPKFGPVSPLEFLPIAEASDLIHRIGAWVMEDACRQWQGWVHAGLAPGRLAVNLSNRQFQNPRQSVPHLVAACLAHTGLDAALLELEITESCLMPALGTRDQLLELALMGVELAIDDFGTGFSSLSTIHRYPISKLKIDRSFVEGVDTNPTSQSIVRATLAMARGLGVNTLAEGVERPEELAFLRRCGCPAYQGYLFSRPLAAAQFEALLQKGAATAPEPAGEPARVQLAMRAASAPLGPRRALLLALLAGLAVLGNMATVPLCFSIQILLGSIASTLCLLWLRGWWNVAITAIASLYTWTLWGHPWAILIFSAEALWLAVFVNRFSGPPENDLKGRVILADVVFWLLVGAPLVFYLYGSVLLIDPTNVAVTMAKQAVNGVANTLVAFLLYLLLQLRRHRQGQGLLPLRGLVFSVMLASITLPSLGVTLLSCSQLQRATQEGVLENLLTVGEAAARIDPLQLGEPTRGLPVSIGSAAFLLTDKDGTRISSNPALFLRLDKHFLPAVPAEIKVNGLQILVPTGDRPALRKWVYGYWSTTLPSSRYLVQVIQPAEAVVLNLQEQSTSLLTTLIWVMLLGLLISEGMASLMEGQIRILQTRAAIAAEGPFSSASLNPDDAPEEASAIAEIQGLVASLNASRRQEAGLRQHLAAVSEQLEQCSEQQRRLAGTDPLTGASSSSELELSLMQLSERASACSVPLSCLAFEVHGLRPVNTFHGRQAGDVILQRLIAKVRLLLHANDQLFRIGGSEFLLLLWDQPLESSRTTAEQIRKVVNETALPCGEGTPPKLSMYAGVSLKEASDASGKTMLSRVELALKQSRDLGANQVVVR
ncbi:EAL domain-containing protein [Synechococcus sp. BA-132 BA5]|uniref:EAL domain-containing protein n=1 Tax=Synechococcus sp. BA-132 BA5 TaxID=3110252 RepID=UPI002B1FFC5A|nr:EAL domain-containing protein [Synechococcus sp. BA-132 BA5]MEA5415838.1 EAL domain-containing protein [Synechococcus sp. BA-132 BA5]